MKYPKRIGRPKLKSYRGLINKTDRVFSAFIRKRDGYKCVICKSTLNIQCGHLIKRGKKSLRFDETNCNALCSSCNYKDNFEPWHYTRWFIANYGASPYVDLIERSKRIKKWKRWELEELIEKYS